MKVPDQSTRNPLPPALSFILIVASAPARLVIQHNASPVSAASSDILVTTQPKSVLVTELFLASPAKDAEDDRMNTHPENIVPFVLRGLPPMGQARSEVNEKTQ